MKEKYYWNGPYNPSHITAFYQKRCYVCTQKKILFYLFAFCRDFLFRVHVVVMKNYCKNLP